MAAARTPGRIAYEADVAARPLYDNDSPRRSWEQLGDVAKWSWERNHTPRFCAFSNPVTEEANQMSKHTPGPWHAVGFVIEVEDDDIPDIAAFDPTLFGQGHLRRSDAEIRANVALCAAAPELLAVVKECLDAEMKRRAKLLPNAPAATYCEARIARINAAIAKAEDRADG